MKIYINETKINVISPKEFSTMLFTFLFQDSKYMSFDALKNNIEKLIDTVEEYIDLLQSEVGIKDEVKRELLRMRRTLNRWRIRLRKIYDRNDMTAFGKFMEVTGVGTYEDLLRNALIEWIYSTILTLEGLSLSRGH